MVNVRHLQAYKQNQITTTDSGTVLLLLYQGAIDSVNRATEHMALGNMAEKGTSILRANDIINQFLTSLDHQAGGEIAQNLETLYHYMLEQTLVANVKNDPEPLKLVARLLSTLKEGWEVAIKEERKRSARGAA